VRKAISLARKKGFDAVHARGHIPAAIALRVKAAFNCRFIFDIRGLMADEYVDAGHWRERSVPWRMTKALERRALFAADGVVTLTDRIWPIISNWEGLAGRSVEHVVVPCCADLNRFRFDPDARERVRSELNLKDKFIVVYSGSIGGWYLNEEMADFFAYMLNSRANSHALWLTPTGHPELRRLMESRGISPDRYTVASARPQEVSAFLSASDAGLAFIKPCFSKLASSPTKNAEFLACGLPVIINSDIGDSDSLINVEKVGALVHRFDEENYQSALEIVEEALADRNVTRNRSREVAERLFDVGGVGLARYRDLYDRVISRPLESSRRSRSVVQEQV
jgi:glycosyltransferase involved in cell wall biosynthesis